jgi:hypothetical protein
VDYFLPILTETGKTDRYMLTFLSNIKIKKIPSHFLFQHIKNRTSRSREKSETAFWNFIFHFKVQTGPA